MFTFVAKLYKTKDNEEIHFDHWLAFSDTLAVCRLCPTSKDLPDLQGNPLKLSSLRGKYVVLDFWGSWCIWCIRGIPRMKEAYSKYKDKMEILGVDCQDTEEKWKAAVEEHQLPWLQVRCPEDYLQTLGQQYRIQGFPTKVIIDPQGRLVKVVVGEDPAFYTFLDQLFAK